MRATSKASKDFVASGQEQMCTAGARWAQWRSFWRSWESILQQKLPLVTFLSWPSKSTWLTRKSKPLSIQSTKSYFCSQKVQRKLCSSLICCCWAFCPLVGLCCSSWLCCGGLCCDQPVTFPLWRSCCTSVSNRTTASSQTPSKPHHHSPIESWKTSEQSIFNTF